MNMIDKDTNTHTKTNKSSLYVYLQSSLWLISRIKSPPQKGWRIQEFSSVAGTSHLYYAGRFKISPTLYIIAHKNLQKQVRKRPTTVTPPYPPLLHSELTAPHVYPICNNTIPIYLNLKI